MLNLLPWRAHQIQKIKRNFLLLLSLMLFLITLSLLVIREKIVQKNLQILCQKKVLIQNIRGESIKKVALVKRNSAEQKVFGFLSEIQRQRKYLTILERIPDSLPPNSYLNFLALAKNELKMEGALLTASDLSLKQFIADLTNRYALKLKEQKIQLEKLSEQKFQLTFTL